jgi:tetratricopeptide (TPR) repeat protein
VLGFRPAKAPDGQFRRLAVNVNRTGVVVRARRGYVATPAPVQTTADVTSSEPVRTEPFAQHDPVVDAAVHFVEPPVVEGRIIATDTTSAPSMVSRLRPNSEQHIQTLGPASARDTDADSGWAAYKRGDVEAAQRSLAAAVARPSAAPWMHYALGQSQYALKQYASAVGAWEKVRASNPEFEPVYFDLVDGYLQIKEYDKAIRVMRAATDRWPQDPEVFDALGVVQVARGALDDAVGSFQRAITVAPQEGTAYFNLAKTLELRYRNSRHYIKPMGRWIANEHDRTTAIDNYKRYLDIGGPFEGSAREGLARLEWGR